MLLLLLFTFKLGRHSCKDSNDIDGRPNAKGKKELKVQEESS
jgi:hypothetical protein